MTDIESCGTRDRRPSRRDLVRWVTRWRLGLVGSRWSVTGDVLLVDDDLLQLGDQHSEPSYLGGGHRHRLSGYGSLVLSKDASASPGHISVSTFSPNSLTTKSQLGPHGPRTRLSLPSEVV